MKKYIAIFLFYLLCFCTSIVAQSNLKRAEEAFQNKEYLKAIEVYKKELGKTNLGNNTKSEYYYYIGKCYQKLFSYKNAEKWYHRAFAEQIELPEIYYDYAELLRIKGEYKKAIEYYTLFKETAPDEIELVEKGIESCLYALKFSSNNTILNCSLEEDISTLGEEKNPVLYNKTLYYLSSVFLKDIEKEPQKQFLLYESSLFNENFVSPTLDFSKRRALQAFTFDESSNQFFIAIKEGKNKSTIYTAPFKNWQKLKKSNMPTINAVVDGMCICKEGKRLYFSAELAGGYGGKDLWYIDFQAGRWSMPINLGDLVNTEEDEITPFILADTLLVFASNGQIESYGGFDIYASYINDDFGNPINLGKSINTSYDDFGFCFQNTDYYGVLLSNRTGKRETDIFRFGNLFSTQCCVGKVVEAVSERPIIGANVQIFTNERLVLTTQTDENGWYHFYVPKGARYTVRTSKQNYFNASGPLNLNNEVDFVCVENEMKLDFFHLEQEYELKSVFTSMYTTEISDQGRLELNRIVNFLSDNEHLNTHFSLHINSIIENGKYLELLASAKIDSISSYLTGKGILSSRVMSSMRIDSSIQTLKGLECKLYFQLSTSDTIKERSSSNAKNQILYESTQLSPIKMAKASEKTIYFVHIETKEVDVLEMLSNKALDVDFIIDSDENGNSQYYAGMFLLKANAIDLVNRLKSIGVNSCIIDNKSPIKTAE